MCLGCVLETGQVRGVGVFRLWHKCMHMSEGNVRKCAELRNRIRPGCFCGWSGFKSHLCHFLETCLHNFPFFSMLSLSMMLKRWKNSNTNWIMTALNKNEGQHFTLLTLLSLIADMSAFVCVFLYSVSEKIRSAHTLLGSACHCRLSCSSLPYSSLVHFPWLT